MARWTGDPHITDVLRAADAWRERCVLADGSLFSEERLWTLDNINELSRRFVANPIEGTDRDFYEKLKEQLSGAKPEVIRLAAEVVWFLLLFPHHTRFGPDKKIIQIRTVWNWSGAELPDSPFLYTKCLMGVGSPGTAYLTRRYEQFGFLLDDVLNERGIRVPCGADLGVCLGDGEIPLLVGHGLIDDRRHAFAQVLSRAEGQGRRL